MSKPIAFPAICVLLALAIPALASCKPASDEYQQRGQTATDRDGPMAPTSSPDTAGAIWAGAVWADPVLEGGQHGERLLYGIPGAAPLLALECLGGDDANTISITRFVAADPEAKALMAMIGNGNMARLPVDATWNGRVSLWQGTYRADNSDLDVFSGPRQIEVTIPGAGTVTLNPSPRPAHLLQRCRQPAVKPAAP